MIRGEQACVYVCERSPGLSWGVSGLFIGILLPYISAFTSSLGLVSVCGEDTSTLLPQMCLAIHPLPGFGLSGWGEMEGAVIQAVDFAPTPVLLLGEFHGQRSVVGYSPWGCKKLDMNKHISIYSLDTIMSSL